MRAAYEAELSRISSADMILQTAVSLLNLGGRRLGLAPGSEGERDLDQVRDAVDGVSALLGILERSASAQELRPLRDALSQLQMAFVQGSGGTVADAVPAYEFAESEAKARAVLESAGVEPDYVAVADLDGPTLAIAARVGSTRLIDNTTLHPTAIPLPDPHSGKAAPRCSV